MKRKELIFTGGILVLAAMIWLLYSFNRSDAYGTITITVQGKTYGTYSLGKDQVIPINNTNICEIKDGQARMIDASCPDLICMEFVPISERGGLIVCLPNDVLIEGQPLEKNQSDN